MKLSAKWVLRPGHFPVAGLTLMRLTQWLNLLLVILLANTLAQLTWSLVQEPAETLAVAPSAFAVKASASSVKQSSPVSLEKVAALHLLGRSDAPLPAEEAKPIVAPETRLNLTLRGLIAINSQQGARAIIAQERGNEQSYKVGDTVPGGAILHEIHADRVIIERSGRFETLTLPKEKVVIGNPPGGSTPVPAQVSPLGGLVATPSAADARQWQAIRQTVLKNPQEAMGLVNAQPVMEGGQLKGYRVNPGRDRALFNSAGLRPGDIVTSVNGIALNDMSQMGALFEQLSSAAQLDVTVERRGQQTRLSLTLE